MPGPRRTATNRGRVAVLVVLLASALVTAGTPLLDRAGGVPHDLIGSGDDGAVGGLNSDGPTVGDEVGFSEMSLLWMEPELQARALDAVVATGARWIRVDFPWSWIERAGPGRFDWSVTDRLVVAARARGLQLLALLTYSPPWARPAGAPSDKYGPTDPTAMSGFARAAVRRYAPLGVRHWEIWNEPNLSAFWRPAPDPLRYAALLRSTAAVIHDEDRAAIVVSGGLAPAVDRMPQQMAPFTFLRRMYEAGAQGGFDAVGMHPYSFPYPSTTSQSWNLFATQPAFHALMAAYGDGDKQIWATELGWPTGHGARRVDEATQAARVVQAVRAWRAYRFAGPMFLYNFRDLGTDAGNLEHNFGVVRHDLSPKPAAQALEPVLGAAAGDRDGAGPWLVSGRGRALATAHPPAPQGPADPAPGGIVAAAATPSGRGVWMLDRAGRVSTRGDARFYGQPVRLHSRAVGIAASRDGRGYLIATASGRVLTFGSARDARMTARSGGRLRRADGTASRVAALVPTPSGRGYWVVSADGAVAGHGDARVRGGLTRGRWAAPVVGLAPTPAGFGYWLLTADGAVHPFGTARGYGAMPAASRRGAAAVAIVATRSGQGYWVVAANGRVGAFGDAPRLRGRPGTPTRAAVLANRPVTR